jgi:hypothetical protein
MFWTSVGKGWQRDIEARWRRLQIHRRCIGTRAPLAKGKWHVSVDSQRGGPMRLVIISLLVSAWLGIGAAQAADNSSETTDFVVLSGHVKSIDWSGRALQVVFHSNDGYDGADWTLQGPAPKTLVALGWKRDLVKPGDRLSAAVIADQSGTANARLLRFYLPNYQTLETTALGSAWMYPRGAIRKTIAEVTEDPLATLYGNTLFYVASANKPPEANLAGRMWINADHTFWLLGKKTPNGLNADGSFDLGTDVGHWWIERQLGKPVLCLLANSWPMPRCDTAVKPRKVGEKWNVTVHGANTQWTETWELQQGRRR